jgi:hypothetical protein
MTTPTPKWTHVKAWQVVMTCFWLLLSRVQLAHAQQMAVRVGPQEVVFPDGYHGMHYFPDEPISVIQTSPFTYFMVETASTVLMQGESLETAVPIGRVLQPGGRDSFDNGYAGISSALIDGKTKELLAFYHAEDHVGIEPPDWNKDLKGFYGSIGLAVSNDGTSFSKIGQIITGSLPKGQSKDVAQGVGDVSVCRDHTGEYLFAYHTDHSRLNNRGVVICLARSRVSDAGRPGTWFKYRNGEFNEKGLGGTGDPIEVRPKAFSCDAFLPNVHYLKPMRKYVMVFNVMGYADHLKPTARQSGIYFASSEDGIKWSEPQRVLLAHSIPYNNCEVAMRPSLVLRQVTAKKVSGDLIYGYSPSWGTTAPQVPHFMAKNPIAISTAQGTVQKPKSSHSTNESSSRRSSPISKSDSSFEKTLVGKYRLDLTDADGGATTAITLELHDDKSISTSDGRNGSWAAKGKQLVIKSENVLMRPASRRKDGTFQGTLTDKNTSATFRYKLTKTE